MVTICLQCRRPGFDPWIGKTPWRKEWLLFPVFLPREFRGQRSLMGYSPWGHKESDRTEQAHTQTHGEKNSSVVTANIWKEVITEYVN